MNNCNMFCVIECSDVVLESGSVLELDSSPYFEDSDSNPLDSDSNPRLHCNDERVRCYIMAPINF